jgi:hypothetical protein
MSNGELEKCFQNLIDSIEIKIVNQVISKLSMCRFCRKINKEDEHKECSKSQYNNLSWSEFIKKLNYNGYGITNKISEYEFELYRGSNKIISKWQYDDNWYYSIHFSMKQGETKLSFWIEYNDNNIYSQEDINNFIPEIKDFIDKYYSVYDKKDFKAFCFDLFINELS